jgi:hypothetical protein
MLNISENSSTTSLVYSSNSLYMCDIHPTGGVVCFNLATHTTKKVVSNGSPECSVAHGITPMSDGSFMITDSASRQVKRLHPDGSIDGVIAGTGQPTHQFGPAERGQFGQPTAITSEGQSSYIVDTCNATISLLTGTQGLMTYIQKIGNLFDIFYIHTKKEVPVENACSAIDNVVDYFEGTVEKVRTTYKLKGSIQGPQGPARHSISMP